MKWVLIISFCLISFSSFSQIELDSVVFEESKPFREVSLNVSPLLFRLIPFSLDQPGTGPFSFAYAWGRDEHAFRFGLGFDILSNNAFESYALIRVGYEYNRPLIKNLIINSSYDFWIGGGGFNLPNKRNDADAIVGFAMGLGIKYFITDQVFFSTESHFYIGTYDGFILNVIPPVSVMFGFRI